MCVLVFHSSFGDPTLRLSFIYSFTHTHTRASFFTRTRAFTILLVLSCMQLRKSVVNFDHFSERERKAEAEGGEGRKRGRSKRRTKCKGKEKKIGKGWLCLVLIFHLDIYSGISFSLKKMKEAKAQSAASK